MVLKVEPESPEARRLPVTQTRAHTLSPLGPVSSWSQGEHLPCLFFFCSSSSPGTPGMPRKVLCEFPYHTSSSWSGGIICKEGGDRRSGTSLHGQEALSWPLSWKCGSSLSPGKAALGSISAERAATPGKLHRHRGRSAPLSPPKASAISIPSLLQGTELPPGHANAPKLMRAEQQAEATDRLHLPDDIPFRKQLSSRGTTSGHQHFSPITGLSA